MNEHVAKRIAQPIREESGKPSPEMTLITNTSQGLMKPQLRKVALLVSAILAVVILAGCVTTRQDTTPLKISLSATGRASVQGRVFPMAQLGQKLRVMAVPTSKLLEIAIPDDMDMALLKTAGRALAGSGYRNFIFKKPRETVSEIAQKKSKASSQATRKAATATSQAKGSKQPATKRSSTSTTTGSQTTASKSVRTNVVYSTRNAYSTNTVKISTNWVGSAGAGTKTKSSKPKTTTRK